MSFLLACPLCGPRSVYEFRFGGEIQKRPVPGSPPEAWATYLYARTNVAGVERAWWFHRTGCRRWFQAERDTRDNQVIRTAWKLDAPAVASAAGHAASAGPAGSPGATPPDAGTSAETPVQAATATSDSASTAHG